LAGEEVDMPLLFFIDKDVLDDPACRNLDDVVLSYTFFKCVFFRVLSLSLFIARLLISRGDLSGRDGIRKANWNLMHLRT
jgi:hypothetical protein